MDENTKQKLQKLIEYQKKDIELRKLNLLIEKDEALAVQNKQERIFFEAKQTLSESDNQSDALLELYNELKKYVEDNTATFAELEGVEPETDEEFTERIKKLESLKNKFTSAERKIHDIDEKAKELCRVRIEAIRNGKIAKQKYSEAKEKHGELVKQKAGELNRIKTELAAMRGGLDERLFAEYSKLANENIFPPVVPARGDDKKSQFNCGGCGLTLPQQSNALIMDQGWCRCDTCHRLIVKLK